LSGDVGRAVAGEGGFLSGIHPIGDSMAICSVRGPPRVLATETRRLLWVERLAAPGLARDGFGDGPVEIAGPPESNARDQGTWIGNIRLFLG